MSDDEDLIKIAYFTREGYESSAYINPKTGRGVRKHSNIPLIVEWDDVAKAWVQVDKWEWEYNPISGEFDRADDLNSAEYREAWERANPGMRKEGEARGA